MKKDPTRVLLIVSMLFYGVVGLARLYFFLCPVCSRSEFSLSWIGLAGNLFGIAICVFLLSDADDKRARLFWVIHMLDSLITMPFRTGAFWYLPRHGDLIAVITACLLAVITACFLAAYFRDSFSLFGQRSRRFLEMKEEQNN